VADDERDDKTDVNKVMSARVISFP